MEVVVRKTTRGPDFKKTLQVNESDTLSQLKSKIFEVFGISPHTQFLHCFGRDLDDDSRTLEGLGIKDESVIFIVQYASAQRKKSLPEYHHQFTDTHTQDGLNYESVCNNSNCKAYQQTVVINLGFRKSVLQRDRWESNKCPMCDNTCGDITRVLFSKCAWQIKGYTEKGEKIQKQGVADKSTEEDPSPANQYKWSYLEIITTNLT